MLVGDKVIYKERHAKIIEIKWGCCKIEYFDDRKQVWVNPKDLKRKDL